MSLIARLRVFLLLAIIFIWPAGAQDTIGTAQEKVAAPAQAISIEPVARDDEIERRILEILKATGWYRAPRVDVKDGVVFLDGVTESPDQKAWARELASKTQDVVAVVNRIDIEPKVRWTFKPALQELFSLAHAAVAALPLILFALVILPIAWLVAKWVALVARRQLAGRIGSPFLQTIIARAIALPAFLLGLYLVLQVAGLTQLALSVIGGAGVLGIIFGFAFRDIAENFLASLLLSIRRPFRGGDLVDVSDQHGIVQSMNTRSTLLLSPDGNQIQIPNAVVFKSTIVNYSAAPARRDTLEVGIGFDVSIAAAQEIIRDVLHRHSAVMNDPDPLVLVDSLGSATVNLRVYYWFDGSAYALAKVKSALLRLIKKALTEEGISMPDEAREIIFPQGVPIISLGGESEQNARALATRDIEESVRAEASAMESDENATSSEGDLENEQAEVEEHAAAPAINDDETDLLADKA